MIENRAYIDVEDAVVISEAVPETNLLDWKFCEFEFQRCALTLALSHRARVNAVEIYRS